MTTLDSRCGTVGVEELLMSSSVVPSFGAPSFGGTLVAPARPGVRDDEGPIGFDEDEEEEYDEGIFFDDDEEDDDYAEEDEDIFDDEEEEEDAGGDDDDDL